MCVTAIFIIIRYFFCILQVFLFTTTHLTKYKATIHLMKNMIDSPYKSKSYVVTLLKNVASKLTVLFFSLYKGL